MGPIAGMSGAQIGVARFHIARQVALYRCPTDYLMLGAAKHLDLGGGLDCFLKHR